MFFKTRKVEFFQEGRGVFIFGLKIKCVCGGGGYYTNFREGTQLQTTFIRGISLLLALLLNNFTPLVVNSDRSLTKCSKALIKDFSHLASLF